MKKISTFTASLLAQKPEPSDVLKGYVGKTIIIRSESYTVRQNISWLAISRFDLQHQYISLAVA